MNEEYILFSKKGNNAKVSYDGGTEVIVNSFKIEYYVPGDAYLFFEIKKQNSDEVVNPSKIEFRGETDDGYLFEIDITKDFNENPFHFKFFDSVSKRIQILRPVTLKKRDDTGVKFLRQHFANFLFDYNSTTTNGFLININKKEFRFKNSSRYKEMKEIIEKTNIPKITGCMESDFVDDYENIKKISKNIFELISYSQRQFIQVIFDEFIDESNEVAKLILFPQVLRPARSGFTVVESCLVYEPDQSIRKFIEQTYSKYVEWKEKIKLDYSLTYYLLAFIPKQGEVEYILVFTAVESLVRHYQDYFMAKKGYNLQEILQAQFKERIKSKLSLKDNEISILTNPENKFYDGNLPFDNSLNILYKGKITSSFKDESYGFKLKRDNFDLKAPQIRNKVIHNGEFHDYSNLDQISDDTKNIVYMFDKIFLTILDYKGFFRDYRDIEKWIKLKAKTKNNNTMTQIQDVTLINKGGKLKWIK